MISDASNSTRFRFSWTHLLRACSISLSIRQMILSILAVVFMSCVNWISNGFSGSMSASVDTSHQSETDNKPSPKVETPLVGRRAWQDLGLPEFEPLKPMKEVIATEMANVDTYSGVLPANPWRSLIAASQTAFGSPTGSLKQFRAISDFIICLVASSLFGLAICRLAAFNAVQQESGSIRKSIQFSIGQCLQAVMAPLIPLGAAAVLFVGLFLLSLPGRIIFVGSIWTTVTSPLFLLAGIGIVLLAMATAIGWPLMVSGIAVANCDGFGGLSRSYSLWTGRPIHAIGFAVLATVMSMLLQLVGNSVCTWAQSVAILSTSGDSARILLGSCMTTMTSTLLAAFTLSLFWTNAVLIYLLLTELVDGVPIDSHPLSDEVNTTRDPFPVVGIPATDAKAE